MSYIFDVERCGIGVMNEEENWQQDWKITGQLGNFNPIQQSEPEFQHAPLPVAYLGFVIQNLQGAISGSFILESSKKLCCTYERA